MSADAASAMIQRICAYGVHVADGSILLVRASAITEVAGRWFLPGGGVDFGEHPTAALRREVAEETGLATSVGEHLGVVSDIRTRRSGVKVHSVRMIFALSEVAGELVHETTGSSDLARFVPIEEARTLPLAHYVVEGARFMGLDLTPASTHSVK